LWHLAVDEQGGLLGVGHQSGRRERIARVIGGPDGGLEVLAYGIQELKSRGLCYCFISFVDGLKGLPEAIEAIFPRTHVQLCIVHKLRN